MNTPTPRTRSALLTDVALAASLAIFIAGLCIALVWVVPLELYPPRVR